MNEVHFSNKSDEWETPQGLFDKYDADYAFDLDAAASSSNKKCDNYFTSEDNGLSKSWYGTVWCNPPYSNVKSWIKKAYEESLRDVTTVMLIPARVDTIAWHTWIFPHAKVEFLRGRLKFSNSKNSAPFPSAIVIFEGKREYEN